MIDYQRLEVWRRAHALTMEVYRVTRTFPSEERFALAVQLRRAMASVPCNLAEGSARSTDRAFASFAEIAEGSSAEAQYELCLAHELGYLEPAVYEAMARELVEVRRMLARLRARLRRGESNLIRP
jgi:four helix bundle protein